MNEAVRIEVESSRIKTATAFHLNARTARRLKDAEEAAALAAWEKSDMTRRMEGLRLELSVSESQLSAVQKELSEARKRRKMWLTGKLDEVPWISSPPPVFSIAVFL